MKYCSNCNAQLSAGWRACPSCGQLIELQAPAASKVDALSMTSMWLSVAGLALMVFGGMGGLVSLAGVVCGHIAQGRIRGAGGTQNTYSKVGLILGYIGIAISAVLIMVAAVMLGAGFSWLIENATVR